jgi:hypothetical protein
MELATVWRLERADRLYGPYGRWQYRRNRYNWCHRYNWFHGSYGAYRVYRNHGSSPLYANYRGHLEYHLPELEQYQTDLGNLWNGECSHDL